MNNYGLILKQLRQINGYSLKTAAQMVGKSVGWFSEVENCRGLSRLQPEEFERIVKLFGGEKHRELFKTWVAVQRNKDRTDRSLDGPVLKYIRERKELTLSQASKLVGLSKGYLTNIENGHKLIKLELRNRIMVAYGYSPSSFKNLSTDEKRSKAVPVRYKINSLLNQMEEADLYATFDFIAGTIANRPKISLLQFLNENQ